MKKSLLLGAALLAAASAFAQETETTYYIIGSNVNGNSWALAAPDAAFEAKGGGIYEWNGQVLGAGFKINDGTWDNENVNWGSNGEEIVLGEAYYYGTSGAGNIGISGYPEVANPKVVLDTNAGTITLTGDASGSYSWYCVGDFQGWNVADPASKMTEVSANVFEVKFTVPAEKTTGSMKVSTDGWAKQYGTNDGTVNFFDATHTEIALDEVGSEGAIPYTFEAAEYTATFDYENLTLKVVPSGAGVANFEVENGVAKFFDLNGAQVLNPAKGVYVKVVNGKATKTVVK